MVNNLSPSSGGSNNYAKKKNSTKKWFRTCILLPNDAKNFIHGGFKRSYHIYYCFNCALVQNGLREVQNCILRWSFASIFQVCFSTVYKNRTARSKNPATKFGDIWLEIYFELGCRILWSENLVYNWIWKNTKTLCESISRYREQKFTVLWPQSAKS